MIVRPVAPHDLPTLRDLFLQSRRAAFVWGPPSSLTLGDFDSQTDGEFQMIALDGERPSGFISIWKPGNFVHHLPVHPVAVSATLLLALPGWPTTRYRLKCLAL